MLCETVCRSFLTSAGEFARCALQLVRCHHRLVQSAPHWYEHLHVWTVARPDSEIHVGETWDIERRSLDCTRQHASENVRAHR